jgi:hypothetical protein
MAVGGAEFVHISIPMAVQYKALLRDQLLIGIADSKPTPGMDVRLLGL